MHMTTSYRDHTYHNERLHQQSEQPMNLQMLQPPKPQQENIRDRLRKKENADSWKLAKFEN